MPDKEPKQTETILTRLRRIKQAVVDSLWEEIPPEPVVSEKPKEVRAPATESSDDGRWVLVLVGMFLIATVIKLGVKVLVWIWS